MLNVAIVGATGYTGVELTKILLKHKKVKLVCLTTRQKKAIPLRRYIPSLPKKVKLKVESFDFDKVCDLAEVVFLCLPHKEAANTGVRFRKAGKVVIDLSADFRLKDAKLYDQWYGLKHPQKTWLKKAVYGLPEFNRSKIKTADLIANPGCYPTAASLGIAPLLKAKLIESSSIVIDAKSGVSGAGRAFAESKQFYGAEGDFYPYKVGRHQHTPEIEQTLATVTGKKVKITFVTHLLPVHQGILTTIYAKRKKGTTPAKIEKALKAAYKKEPFTRVRKAGEIPTLKDVRYTNYCDVGFCLDARSDRVIIVTAIDNLIKGAAGQAVQNMNIRFGIKESIGLTK